MTRTGVNFARCATVVAFAASGFGLTASPSAAAAVPPVPHTQTRAATTYHYTVDASVNSADRTDTYTGHGTFQVPSGTTRPTPVLAPHGSMTAVLHNSHGTHTILLTLTRATFSPTFQTQRGVAPELDAVFNVTRSTATCEPAGRQVTFSLVFSQKTRGSGTFYGGLCNPSALSLAAKMSLSHS